MINSGDRTATQTLFVSPYGVCSCNRMGPSWPQANNGSKHPFPCLLLKFFFLGSLQIILEKGF